MSKTAIRDTVSASVTLGAGGYGDRLTVTSTGAVDPATAGAAGIYASAATTDAFVVVRGSVMGGAAGGIGVDLEGGGHISNTGTITGGAGSGSSAGADGIVLNAPGLLINAGTITGGAGGQNGGQGGAGVYLDGGTLVTSGLISGGVGATAGLAGDAVQFGSQASMLELQTSAAFAGVVAANANVNDTLLLAGTSGTGTLAGLGSAFTGFDNVVVHDGANWVLGGTNTLSSGTLLKVDGALAVTGTLYDTAMVQVLAEGSLQVSGLVHAGSMTLEGGTVSESGSGALVVGNGNAEAGALVVANGGYLYGSGTVNGPINDAGTIDANGRLNLNGAVSGTGSLIVDAGGIVLANSSFNVAVVDFTGGSKQLLSLSNPISFQGVIDGFNTGDRIALGSMAATGLNFADGVLTVYNGSTVADTMNFSSIDFSGDYTTADFALVGAAGDRSIVFSGTTRGSLSDAAAGHAGTAFSGGQDAAFGAPHAVTASGVLSGLAWLHTA